VAAGALREPRDPVYLTVYRYRYVECTYYVDALTQHLGEGVSSFLSFVLGFPWELASGWGVIFIPGTRDASTLTDMT
jgi:hypothetical protein